MEKKKDWDTDNDPPRSVSVPGYMQVRKVFASTNASKYHADLTIYENEDPGAQSVHVDGVICFHGAFQKLCQQSPEELLSGCEQLGRGNCFCLLAKRPLISSSRALLVYSSTSS